MREPWSGVPKGTQAEAWVASSCDFRDLLAQGAFFVSHCSAHRLAEKPGPLLTVERAHYRSHRLEVDAHVLGLKPPDWPEAPIRQVLSEPLCFTLFQSVALLEVLARWPASQPSSADHSPVQRRSGAQRQQHTLSPISAQYAAQYAIPYPSDTLHCWLSQRPKRQKMCLMHMMHNLHLYFDLVAELEVHHLAPSMLPPLQSVLPCQPLHWRPHSRRPPCLRRRP